MSPCPAPLCQDEQEGDRSDKNPPGFHGQVWAGSGPSPWLGDTEAHPPAPSAPGWVHHPGWVLVPGCLGGAPQLPDEGQAPRVFSSGQVRSGLGRACWLAPSWSRHPFPAGRGLPYGSSALGPARRGRNGDAGPLILVIPATESHGNASGRLGYQV